MKVQTRRALMIRWLVITAVFSVFFVIPICAGMLAHLAWNMGADHWVEPLLQVPMASFWASLLPVGSMNQKPFPPVFYIVFGIIVALIFCGGRVRHHVRMLTKENEARELRDL